MPELFLAVAQRGEYPEKLQCYQLRYAVQRIYYNG
jgi:hypothetical protein